MSSSVYVSMELVFGEIKDPEELNNICVNHAAFGRTNLPAAPCSPSTAAFWGLELLVFAFRLL